MVGALSAKAMVLGGLSAVASIVKKLATVQKNDSLVQFTSVLRVEPITLIDKSLERQEYLGEILQTLLNLFCGYYLQAVACMTNVGQINVIRMLDALNPTRDGATAASSFVDALNGTSTPSMLSMESYDQPCLPSLENIGAAAASAYGKARRYGMDNELQAKSKELHGSLDAKPVLKESIRAAQEANNLAVGKLLDVNIESNGNRGSFPVSVRLATVVTDSNVLVHILGGSGSNNTFRERWWRWKAGEISLWRDLIFCQDLIDEQKRLMMRDKSGAMAEINRRRALNSAATMASGNPSIGSASALIVIDQLTVTELERHNQGKISDPRFRDNVLHNSLGMIIAVVNTDYETVTFYTRGIDLPSKFQIRQLKAANKNGGPDITEIFKMFRMGQPAIF